MPPPRSSICQVPDYASIPALERYIISGNERLVPMIRSSTATAIDSLAEALAQDKMRGDDDEIATLQELSAGAAVLSEVSEQVITLRQSGDLQGARTALDAASPAIGQCSIGLTGAVDFEREEVATLRSQANRAGHLALWLLLSSGLIEAALALAIAVLIARSILRPLSSVASAALAVADGELQTRAPATGPRELARLGPAVN